MAVLKLDPPPASDDINTLRSYINDLYDAICNIVYNLDSDNMSEEFLESIYNNGSGET